MTLLDRLRAATPEDTSSNVSLEVWRSDAPAAPMFQSARARPPVQPSQDLQRILGLPRRPQVDLYGLNGEGSVTAQALVELMNGRLMLPNRKPGTVPCKCASMGRKCVVSLQPAQAWALYEAPLVGGLLGHLSVGSGKTSLNFLMAMVMPRCKLAVVLIPPTLRQQLLNEYLLWSEHWRVPSLILEGVTGGQIVIGGRPVLHVIPYSKLSRPESTSLFTQLQPDAIFADECHRLSNIQSAGAGRFVRFLAEHDSTRFCGWSGTVTNKTIAEYAHLAAISLRETSPLPLEPPVVEEWALALDPSPFPAGAGALRRLCNPTETLYQGFHRRLVETKGVVVTRAGSIDASLTLHERVPGPLPPKLQAMLEELRADGVRPDGEELVDILEISMAARQLACGFFYRWKFPRVPRQPNGEPTEEAKRLILEWFAKRKSWRRELREKLKRREEHLDSEHLCTLAAARAYQDPPYEGDLPVWEADFWTAWRDIKDKVYHETEAVWVDDYLAADAAAWGLKHRGVVWYEHDAFGRRVGELSQLPVHGGGPGAEARILAEKGDHSIIASIKSHGTGRDGLQRVFREQLVTNPPSSGKEWEQLLGRLSRVGQEADEVECYLYRHVPEMADAIDQAVMRARYVHGTFGANQMLLACNCTFTPTGKL